MDYLYCCEFPAAARAKVKATKILAARDFEKAKENLRRVTEVEAALRTYLLQGFPELRGTSFRTGAARYLERRPSRPGIARVPPPSRHRGRGGERRRPLGTRTVHYDQQLEWRHSPRSSARI